MSGGQEALSAVEHNCAFCGGHHAADRTWVIENTDGKFVASFATHLLAHYFVEEGNGCYRYRTTAPAAGALETVLAFGQRLATVPDDTPDIAYCGVDMTHGEARKLCAAIALLKQAQL